MDLRSALKAALERHKLSRTWLSEASGVSHSQISNFLNGHRGCEYVTLVRLIDALPQDARRDFCLTLSGHGGGRDHIEEAIATLAASDLSDEQLGRLLQMAARQLRREEKAPALVA